jgi:hypothetical protein
MSVILTNSWGIVNKTLAAERNQLDSLVTFNGRYGVAQAAAAELVGAGLRG